MPVPTRQPISKFEKLLAGLNALVLLQPAAKIDFAGQGYLLIGNTDDPYISQGMKDHLRKLGFSEDKETQMFSFMLKDEE